jgi:hypothetical protein
MPNMTDADKKAFTSKVTAGFIGNKAALLAVGTDPTQRITNLGTAEDTIASSETLVSQLEVTLKTATDARRKAIDDAYALASASVSLAEGALGKDHPFVVDLHQIRGGMSQTPPESPKP